MGNKLFNLPALMMLLSWSIAAGQTETAMNTISEETINSTTEKLINEHGTEERFRIERGVKQAAMFWKKEDGTQEEFENFCLDHFAGGEEEMKELFEKISRNSEIINGYFNKMSRGLTEPLHLETGPLSTIDIMYGGYDPSAHLTEDFFGNRIAFLTLLNFPFFTLEEKNEKGGEWSRLEWAYARVGDMYTSRIPPDLSLQLSETVTKADRYVSEYNIMMGSLVDEEGDTLFAEDLRLISHWGLRDEIKSLYGVEDGLKKQRMIAKVMERIIRQEIPQVVINNPQYQWAPYSNKVFREGEEVDFEREPDTRYSHLLNVYGAVKATDPYTPHHPDYISRRFEEEMEIPREEIEKLFRDFISSPQAKKVGELIKSRLDRDLEPFDIWYDGFKTRKLSTGELDRIIRRRFPNSRSFENNIPNKLVKLGFSFDKASEIASRITVQPARGAGHAWGAEMRTDNSHLRTRIGEEGMDYQGYNVAAHELGHNVEQTITLYDIDYYKLRGVPNTAFTEAVAFMFQNRDMELLGLSSEDQEHMRTLDTFWSIYEIMGVSLVDIEVWKWLYLNPDASEQELKEKVIEIAKEIWNEYYAPVFNVEDSPVLAIYSHMISYPLYLSAYPLGHLISFQMEEKTENDEIAAELQKMLLNGNLTPKHWMLNSVGREISGEPVLKAVEEALEELK